MRAHPRSRGENCPTKYPKKTCRGSSPLTRGKQPVDVDLTSSDRLIPAHAGKTYFLGLCLCLTTAHPRSRGENLDVEEDNNAPRGSSPLTRGKHGYRDCSLVGLRLIPAHAGKTRANEWRCSA